MYAPKLKPYLKKLDYSYTFGVYPTLELLKEKPKSALKLVLSTDAQDNQGALECVKICEELKIPYEVNDRAIEKIAYKENTLLIGIFEKYEETLESTADHLLLSNPRNMGNLGTIIRTMIGMGIHDLALIGSHADYFDPKVVRSAMGALFHVRVESFRGLDSYYEKYGETHKVSGFALQEDSQSLQRVEFDKSTKHALLFGNEGAGLSEQELKLVDRVIKIEQNSEIDSFNLAVSTTIAMWEFSKQRKAIK